MNKITAEIRENDLVISREKNGTIIDYLEVRIDDIPYKETQVLPEVIKKEEKEIQYQIFLLEKIEGKDAQEDQVILVYSTRKYIKYILATRAESYRRLIVRHNRLLHVKLNSRSLSFLWFGYIVNRYQLDISDIRVFVDEFNCLPCNVNVYADEIEQNLFNRLKNIHKIDFRMDELIYKNAVINCGIKILLTVNGIEVSIPMKKKINKIEALEKGWREKMLRRNYYVPFKSKFYQDHAFHIRRSLTGNIILVRRMMEDFEHTFKFKVLENRLVSLAIYNVGKIVRKCRKSKINLFYEKFAEKAEEGSYNLFLKAQDSTKSKSYYIIREDTDDYNKIKSQKNVVRKFSLKYYWLLYTSNSFISTESPTHINIIRSNNKYIRQSYNEKEFIFLQHGVTYMKCHGVNSPFVVGKEATPSYLIVGSQKEKRVVSEMLGLDEERILNTGLPIFSNVEYKHLNEQSKDIAVIMLTWKPYEEYLEDFEMSSYYKNIVAIYDILIRYLEPEDVIIVPHPKIRELMENTRLKDSVWNRPISEVLSFAKLLITDYSSVCYNSFYQGGGVVFFQEDLDYYEHNNGKLIPEDDEYIGERVFSVSELEKVLKKGLDNHKIILSRFRTAEFEKRYLTINEYTDGKNIERIYNELLERNIL